MFLLHTIIKSTLLPLHWLIPNLNCCVWNSSGWTDTAVPFFTPVSLNDVTRRGTLWQAGIPQSGSDAKTATKVQEAEAAAITAEKVLLRDSRNPDSHTLSAIGTKLESILSCYCCIFPPYCFCQASIFQIHVGDREASQSQIISIHVLVCDLVGIWTDKEYDMSVLVVYLWPGTRGTSSRLTVWHTLFIILMTQGII